MRYLKTNFKLFLESHQKEGDINKYEIAQFTEDFTISDVYGIDRNIKVNVSKGEKVKLYFDLPKSQEDKYVITGIRPVEVSHNEAKKSKAKEKKKTSFKLHELWEANFILNSPMVIDKNTAPFEIEKYI